MYVWGVGVLQWSVQSSLVKSSAVIDIMVKRLLYCFLFRSFSNNAAIPALCIAPLLTIQSVKKISPPTLFRIFPLRLSFFCMKFFKFVGNSYRYPHIRTNFGRFILIFHQMALIFPQVPTVLRCQVLSRAIQPENENAAFWK